MTPCDDAALLVLAERCGAALRAAGLRLSVAESCTGGWVGQALTRVPGSSQWFDSGFVTYSNQAKQAVLDVAADSLSRHGAVSEAVAAEMAAGARRQAGADVSLAVTGIAGPDGGSAEKPVGTVVLAWLRGGEAETETHRFRGDREAVRRQAVARALAGLLERL